MPTSLTALAEPVDLYSEWMDAAEEEQALHDRENPKASNSEAPANKRRRLDGDDEPDEDEQQDYFSADEDDRRPTQKRRQRVDSEELEDLPGI